MSFTIDDLGWDDASLSDDVPTFRAYCAGPQLPEMFYRYYNHRNGNVFCVAFPVEKRTPKGAWISTGNDYYAVRSTPTFGRTRRWVPWNPPLSARRVFAYRDKKRALESFIRRKQSQIRILEAQLAGANSALWVAEQQEKAT